MRFIVFCFGFRAFGQFDVVAQSLALRQFRVRIWHWSIRFQRVCVGFLAFGQFDVGAPLRALWQRRVRVRH
jgi:hypothetical protein